MLGMLLTATLAAAPHAVPGAEATLYVPKLEQASGLWAFMQRAGEKSQLLQPATWQGELFPLTPVEYTQPKSLLSIGVNPSGPLSASFGPDLRVSCFTLKDTKAFEARAGQSLAQLGK